jgi:phage terminase small subunit
MSDEPRKLTPKQEQFCQLYTVYWNATRAAKEANYSEKSAARLGHELVNNPLVQKRIAELKEHALNEIGINRERILAEYSRLAFYDLADAYDEIGQLKPIKEMPEDIRRAVVKVKSYEVFGFGDNGDGEGPGKKLAGFTKEVEFAQKKAALDSLAKCLGMAPDKLEHSGPNGKEIEFKNLSNLPDEQLDQLIAAGEAKRQSKPDEPPREN